jgi:predicted transposase/invertase (TIGR01784 family)
MSRYINPYTDFGFKKLFGEEANQDLLIDFLNTLLPEKHLIKTLSFRNQEHLGATSSDRRVAFDVFCEANSGEKFIVEMQKEDQEFFKDRSLYYAAYPIREQGWKGKQPETGEIWDFELKTVYFVGILDFIFDKTDPEPLLINEVSLKDKRGREFYDKLQFIYIQMPLFQLKETQLKTRCDKWLYFLKHLPSLDHIPAILNEQVFEKAFKTAEVAVMTPAERDRYEQETNDYLTYWATLKTRETKGRAEGRADEKIEIARNMKKKGLVTDLIAEITGLSPEEIERLT